MNLTTILTYILLSGYPATHKNADTTKPDTSHVNVKKYVILQFDKQRDGRVLGENSKPAELYASEIKRIESIIGKTVKEYNERVMHEAQLRATQSGKKFNMLADRVVNNPGKYYKQFIASINSKGQKEVWINCMAKVDGERWKNELIMVEDGGNEYFQIKVNLTIGKAYDFSINSIA